MSTQLCFLTHLTFVNFWQYDR